MNKRKLMLVAIALCMAAILLAGGTLAYLTDTDQQTNTFTTGKVGLELDEGTIVTDKIDGRYLSTDTETRTSDPQDYKVFPGDVVVKDPIISLDDDSEYAWVAAKIVVKCPGLETLIGSDVAKGYIDINKVVAGNTTGFITGGLVGNGGATYLPTYHGVSEWHTTGKAYTHQDASKWENGEWVIYMYMAETHGPGAEIDLFKEMHFSPLWTNEQMAIFNNLQIDISAYAVQADGFDDCFTAMATAFPDYFPTGDVQNP